MNYLYESLDKPTRLYIKKCSHCQLKYFGKTTSEDIEKYSGSGLRWNNHLKKHNAESIHLWNSDWYYDTSISRFALKFSYINRIVEANTWANMKPEDGLEGGGPGIEGAKKISRTRSSESWKKEIGYKAAKKCSDTKNSEKWKVAVGYEAAKKCSLTQNDIVWKSTVGKEKVRKDLVKKNDPIWKETVGKEKILKERRTKSNPEWINSTGKQAAKRCSDTKNSEKWKVAVGYEAAKKISKVQQSKEWKAKHFKDCPYCKKKNISPGNFSRWHGENCKKVIL